MSAATRIRQAIDALPPDQRGPWIATPESDEPLGAYAMLMDPIVGAALADLLDAIRGEGIDWPRLSADRSSYEWKRGIFDARDALERAIERSATDRQP